jgi:O-antigen/teichoic acid export membrane protein
VIPKKKLINNQLIKFGFSFGIISLLTSISIIFERFYVMEFVSTYYLGIYSLALKVGIIIQIIMQSILFGWEPYFLSNLKKKNLSLNLNLMLKITIFVSLTLAFFLNLIGDYIILFLGNESYIEAKYYILPIVIGIVFQELHRIPMSGILESKKVYWSTIVQLICLIILIFTLFFLKEVINLKIIVLLICFNYFLRFISLSLISNYLSKIKLNLIELTIILVIYLIIFLIIYYFNIFNLNEFFKFITLILLSGSVLIYFLNLNEVKIIKKILINFFS